MKSFISAVILISITPMLLVLSLIDEPQEEFDKWRDLDRVYPGRFGGRW